MSRYSLIYSVFPDAEQAKKVARSLVEEGQVACANIFPTHLAVYVWEGKVCEAEEVAVIFKTTSVSCKSAMRRIEQLHSYETPCVLEISLAAVAPEFAKWIENAVIEK